MEAKEFVKILKILEKEAVKWNPPVVDLIAATGENAFQVLVATVISARTRDEVTALAASRLFKKASDAAHLAQLDHEQISSLIYPAGFYKTKAINLKKLGGILKDKYQGNVPDTLEKLVELPGVGRKTANLVLSQAFKKPAICVDIHVHRITNRIGFINTNTPLQTEMALREKVKNKYWRMINSLFVAFGQTICKPISPKCIECPLNKTSCSYRRSVSSK